MVTRRIFLTDISKVRPGDVFVAAPELGQVISSYEVTADYGDHGVGPAREIFTTDADPDIWAAPQVVEVYRSS